MAIKETPANFRVYYKSMRAKYTELKEEAVSSLNTTIELEEDLYKEVRQSVDTYKANYNIDLLSFKDFVNNEYNDGLFYKTAKGLFINKKNDYVLVSDLFDIFDLADKQKKIYKLKHQIAHYDKILALTLHQYKELLRTFYTEVQRHLILKGEGYAFENDLGWICINRCHIIKQAPLIDFAATKKRKAELIEQGKRIYNKKEADWCKQNGIEYKAEDARVYLRNEYCYELPLLGCKIPNGSKFKLQVTDYRGKDVRGKSNEELAKMSNGDTNYICNLPLDLRTKLNICNKLDKTLYLNFIRNENQEPINVAKTSRKNRQ